MAESRKNLDAIRAKARLVSEARQHQQQANPLRDPNVVSQSSSAYMERKEANEARVNDEATIRAYASDLLQENSAQNAACAAIVPAKKESLPMSLSVRGDEARKIEGFDDYLPHEILDLILDMRLAAELEQEDKQAVAYVSETLSYQYPRGSFFSKNLACQFHQVHQAANDILDGSQAAVDRVVAFVKNNPSFLQYPTEGCDRLGRRVKGTLLQIAAMAGDVNIRELTEEKKQHRGLVELLQEAGKLSNDVVAPQLHAVLFSEEAVKANASRNQRIMDAVKKFGESILQAGITIRPAQQTVEKFQAAQNKCQLAIDTFRATLQSTLNEVIAAGYVFDTSILHQAMTWFNANLDRFENWWTLASDVFWVNGIGSLQQVTSARDAQVCRTGIACVVDTHHYQIPRRDLKNADGTSLFSSASSRLGLDFFLGYYGLDYYESGLKAWDGGAVTDVAKRWKLYVEQKQKRNKIYAAAGQEICEPLCNSVMRR